MRDQLYNLEDVTQVEMINKTIDELGDDIKQELDAIETKKQNDQEEYDKTHIKQGDHSYEKGENVTWEDTFK